MSYNDPLKHEGMLESILGINACYRCRQHPDKTHDKSAFCPAFATVEHAGRWIPLSTILRALRAQLPGSISIRPAGRTEDPEGIIVKHGFVGLSYNDSFVCRLDAPALPEFSIHAIDVRGRYSPDPMHPHLYMGWRRQLRLIAGRVEVPAKVLFRAVGANPDRTSEEVSRFKAGWL